MNKLILTGVSMMVALLAVGCGAGPDVVATGDTVGSIGAPPTGKVVAPSAATTAAHVSVSGLAAGSDGAPLEGVAVCLKSGAVWNGDCTVSAADGTWILTGVPAHSEVALTLDKEGFVPTVRAVATDTVDVVLPSGDSGLLPSIRATSAMGAPLDTGAGHIQFFVHGATDVTVDAVAMDGTASPATFLGANGQPDAALKSGAQGVFANITAGYHLVTFRSATASCTISSELAGYRSAWNVTAGVESILVPVLPGHVTSPVRVDCSPVAAR